MLIPGTPRPSRAPLQQKLEAAQAQRKKHRAKLPAGEMTRQRPGQSCTSTARALLQTGPCGCWPPTPSTTFPARHLNAYLDDDDEYRAITRETIIRGLGGTITYSPKNITVTLDQPGQPRVARALALLLAEINTSPPTPCPATAKPSTTYALRQSQ